MSQIPQRDRDLFENLFVLEAANNHWGNVARGMRIVRAFGAIVRYNNVKAAIKFQFRDVDNFIHGDFKDNKEIRYVSKTEATRLSRNQFVELAKAVVSVGCIPMATPFDEASVDRCVELDFPIIKIASSDVNDWPLIEKIASTRRPIIVSSGGASEKSLDDVVSFFERRSIPIAVNHCVSLYPSEDHQLELNQIDYLKSRYPNHVIGLSTHEYNDWHSSMLISYAKGARTWERHIDVDYDNSVPCFDRTARCHIKSTSGSSHFGRLNRCAGARERAAGSRQPKKSSISTPSSEGSMPDAIWMRDTSWTTRRSIVTSTSPFLCRRDNCRAGRCSTGRHWSSRLRPTHR
jgi:hypothetical protein